MVVIRLARHGSKNAPFYHLTVSDRANRRDGRHVERVGFFNPLARGKAERLRVDLDRIDYWLSVGAKPSERVGALIKDARTQAQAAAGAAPAA
jgi:small subunit ribosomal protein S16